MGGTVGSYLAVEGDEKMYIPKAVKKTYEEVGEILTVYSEKYLNKEYEELCLHALEKLYQKRPSPLKSGEANLWAAGIIYAIGGNNSIFDPKQPIHMTEKELISPLGVATQTVFSQASQIRQMLRIEPYRAEWCLPSEMGNNAWLWVVSIDGRPYDARMLSVEWQEICYKRGLIPYVPAYSEYGPYRGYRS